MKDVVSPTNTMNKPNEARVVDRGIRNDLMLCLGEFVPVDDSEFIPVDDSEANWGKLVLEMNCCDGFDTGSSNKKIITGMHLNQLQLLCHLHTCM